MPPMLFIGLASLAGGATTGYGYSVAYGTFGFLGMLTYTLALVGVIGFIVGHQAGVYERERKIDRTVHDWLSS